MMRLHEISGHGGIYLSAEALRDFGQLRISVQSDSDVERLLANPFLLDWDAQPVAEDTLFLTAPGVSELSPFTPGVTISDHVILTASRLSGPQQRRVFQHEWRHRLQAHRMKQSSGLISLLNSPETDRNSQVLVHLAREADAHMIEGLSALYEELTGTAGSLESFRATYNQYGSYGDELHDIISRSFNHNEVRAGRVTPQELNQAFNSIMQSQLFRDQLVPRTLQSYNNAFPQTRQVQLNELDLRPTRAFINTFGPIFAVGGVDYLNI